MAILLSNKRVAIMDLCPLVDVNGKGIVLEPLGFDGSTRIVPESVLDDKHVKVFVECGWAEITPIIDTMPIAVIAEPTPVEDAVAVSDDLSLDASEETLTSDVEATDAVDVSVKRPRAKRVKAVETPIE